MLITDLLISPTCLGEAMRDQRSAAAQAMGQARANGIRIWLATGAIGAYRSAAPSTNAMASIATGCQWLSALSCDVDLLDDDPILGLLSRGLNRLGNGTRLLGRRTGELTPEEFLALTPESQPIAFIDLAAQQDRIRPLIESRIHSVLRHGHYIMGPEIAELEAKLAAYVGVKHCITAASGTDTLEIALRALGIGTGDEVITTPFTWISTAETIAQVGAKPVFVDIEPVYFNINVDLIEAAITPHTKAIMPVSLFGQMPDYGRINAIAAKHGLPVIEDGAQSFGAKQNGRRSCGVTTIGSTSFFPAKPLGCYGDGGALFTQDDALAGRMRAIRTHGGEKRHHHPYIGMNGRMDTLQAAIVLAKWESWDWEVEQRGRIGALYTELLLSHGDTESRSATAFEPVSSSVPLCLCGVAPPTVAPGNTHVYAQYTIRSTKRDAVAERLKASGIPTAVYYPKCLHEQPCFAISGFKYGDFPVAELASREVLSLPMHPQLDMADLDRITQAIQAS